MTIGTGSADYGRPRYRVGPSYRVDRIGAHYRVVTSPYPLHKATVIAPGTLYPGWTVVIESAQVRNRSFARENLALALQHAGRIVGALYRVDMRSRFTGAERFVMGRNQCPRRVPCPDLSTCARRNVPGHFHLCKRAPDSPVSVWCTEHTDVPEVPGSVFRALDDTGGD